MIDLIGWLATALFVSSYFLGTSALRRMQMLGALAWMTYGILLGAPPVIVANALVLIAAAWTMRRGRAAESDPVAMTDPRALDARSKR